MADARLSLVGEAHNIRVEGVGMKAYFLALAMNAALTSAALAVDYSGTWEVGVREAGAKNFYLPMTDGRLVIETGNRAAHYDRLNFTTSEQADGLHLVCMNGTRSCGALVLHLGANRLTGAGTLADGDGLMRTVTLDGAHPAPRRAPRVIEYEPTEFHNFYSPDLKPVLHLQAGDTVRTRTLDSRGYDRDGNARAPRGNPLIGAFYIDDAMPGATQMSRWLQDTYGLTPHDVAPILGTAMQYEIAEVVDSEYNVVAKISKETLAKIHQ
ncbi:MAG: hypothetical protein ABSF96_09130 [Steroidobacteraceae bacterium]